MRRSDGRRGGGGVGESTQPSEHCQDQSYEEEEDDDHEQQNLPPITATVVGHAARRPPFSSRFVRQGEGEDRGSFQ